MARQARLTTPIFIEGKLKKKKPLSLPSKTLKGRRPRHPGFLQPGSVPRVHCVTPVHVPRVEVSLGVRKASLSHSVCLAHYQRVVERRERRLVLLPPQMFGCLCTHAGDQRRRPYFPTGRFHLPALKTYVLKSKLTLLEHSVGMTEEMGRGNFSTQVQMF